ncbi:MAG: RNA-binding transcriptional accessory protein [Cyanobacteria bacterium SBLK]|nr:RNA-binding transcriptional accessory protein [Cyanobacteria bacterium SBLK]
MFELVPILAKELSLNPKNITRALELLAEGATIPFIARYRKERTGGLDEIQLREISDRHAYLTELQKRKETILKAIAEQEKLTPELQAKITSCWLKNELEDLYLPYKPKRRTRATQAKEKGLAPLADRIKSLNQKNAPSIPLKQEAEKYINAEIGIETAETALKGAADILAEEIAERSQLRADLRNYLAEQGVFTAKIKKDYPEGSTKYEMYRDYRIKVTKIAPHNILALFRGESEKILSVDIAYDEEFVQSYLESEVIRARESEIRQFYQVMLSDAFKRLMKNSLITEIRSDRKTFADRESIKTFAENLRNLLLSPPAGMKPTMAIDPGFRTGCKVAILDKTGKFREYRAIFPHTGQAKRQDAAGIVEKFIEHYKIELIAIGNGTASRETDRFIGEVLTQISQKPAKVIVNESGASIYSASTLAAEEFPDLDVTVRGAISIGRRLQDPLAELVKIEPKSIGVGQYQHDVEQKLLKQKLAETVESCVNYVGVDLNTASKELLTFVSGITPAIAKNIIAYRNEKGTFTNRRQLLKIAKLGPKAYELAAGFLRIRNGENPLDNTAVHPESYNIVEAIAKDLQLSPADIHHAGDRLHHLSLDRYVSEAIGLPTLQDILAELKKPGRDPRDRFQYATFKEGINEISDIEPGMELEGTITNVANFGAFVDVGVHQDGLIHISKMADYFVKDPKTIVKVGQIVKVKVLDVNIKLKRISFALL